jgi:pyrroline-5-carboxylate reductase
MNTSIAFIGGGNMASAIIQGLLLRGCPREKITVVEPFAEARDRLLGQFGISAQELAGPCLDTAKVVVWAVKPEIFQAAAGPALVHTGQALHLSLAAGIPSQNIARWLCTDRVVRAMPNMPAMVGKGIAGLFARPSVQGRDREQVEQIVRSTGEFLWVDVEEKLDAVTAISGSGPAYVFYFMESMTAAGVDMGLTLEQAHQLTLATFAGASELARTSGDPPHVLRQRVTSKGGTTHAAISVMDGAGLKPQFERALQAARFRAQGLGQEFSSD